MTSASAPRLYKRIPLPLKPNSEIADIIWADPAAPFAGVTPATARRLAELRGAAVRPQW